MQSTSSLKGKGILEDLSNEMTSPGHPKRSSLNFESDDVNSWDSQSLEASTSVCLRLLCVIIEGDD